MAYIPLDSEAEKIGFEMTSKILPLTLKTQSGFYKKFWKFEIPDEVLSSEGTQFISVRN